METFGAYTEKKNAFTLNTYLNNDRVRLVVTAILAIPQTHTKKRRFI